MKRIFVTAALVLLLSTSAARADNWTIGLPKQSPLASLPCQPSVPPVARVQPIIGSTQRVSHFTNPITHKAKYTSKTYNPILGTFGKQKFRA
jgi:hypothetical protein